MYKSFIYFLKKIEKESRWTAWEGKKKKINGKIKNENGYLGSWQNAWEERLFLLKKEKKSERRILKREKERFLRGLLGMGKRWRFFQKGIRDVLRWGRRV